MKQIEKGNGVRRKLRWISRNRVPALRPRMDRSPKVVGDWWWRLQRPLNCLLQKVAENQPRPGSRGLNIRSSNAWNCFCHSESKGKINQAIYF